MKDFDDLYRIFLDKKTKIRPEIIEILSSQRGVEKTINKAAKNDFSKEKWTDYVSRKDYKASRDLPKDISEVIDFINDSLIKLQRWQK